MKPGYFISFDEGSMKLWVNKSELTDVTNPVAAQKNPRLRILWGEVCATIGFYILSFWSSRDYRILRG